MDETQELAKYVLSLDETEQLEYINQILGNRDKAQNLLYKIGLQSRNIRVKRRKKKESPAASANHIINCLHCGKIEYSGAQGCSFCSARLVYWGESDDECASIFAIAQKDKLLHFDQTATERTKVYDDQDDYEDESQDEDVKEKGYTIDMDFAARTVTSCGNLRGKAKEVYEALRQSISNS